MDSVAVKSEPPPARGFCLGASVWRPLPLAVIILIMMAGAICSLYNLVYLGPLWSLWLVKLLSLGWLAWCLWLIYDSARRRGVRGAIVHAISLFVSNRRIDVDRADMGPELVIFSLVLGHRIALLRIPERAVLDIDWSTGQATSMVGRDMNDWSVAIRYDPALASGPDHEPYGYWVHEYQDGPRGVIEPIGRALVDFLLTAGLRLRIPAGSLVGEVGVMRRRAKWVYEVEIAGERFRASVLAGKLPTKDGTPALVREIRGTVLYVELLRPSG